MGQCWDGPFRSIRCQLVMDSVTSLRCARNDVFLLTVLTRWLVTLCALRRSGNGWMRGKARRKPPLGCHPARGEALLQHPASSGGRTYRRQELCALPPIPSPGGVASGNPTEWSFGTEHKAGLFWPSPQTAPPWRAPLRGRGIGLCKDGPFRSVRCPSVMDSATSLRCARNDVFLLTVLTRWLVTLRALRRPGNGRM